MLLILLFLGLSVAFSLFTAMRLANRTVLREFRGAVESLAGASPFQIVGTTRYFDAADVVPLLLNAKTLQSFLPIRVDEATIISSSGEEQRITLIGVDMTHERVNEFGPSLAGSQASEEGGNAFFQYNAVVASSHLRGYARDNRLVFWVEGEGDKLLEVHFQDEESSEIREEESSADGLLSLHGGKVAVADLSLVDLLLGTPGRLSEISLFPKKGVEEDKFVAEISALLPPHMLLSFPDERFQSVSETSSALRMNLVFLGALSLFVGMLLGFQVMRLLVLRREGDYTILLALGLSPRSLGMLVLLESATIGAASGLLGGLLGSGFGIFIVEGVQQTVSHLYEPLYERGLIFDGRILLESILVGVLVGSIAGLLALRRLFATSSLVRGREFHFEQGAPLSPSIRYPLMGVGVLILGVLATSKEVIINPLVLKIGVAPFLAPCAIALAALLIAPTLVWHSVSLLILVFRYFGLSVAVVLALEGIKTRIRDAGIAVAALGVAFGMLLGIVTMISGFQATFEEWLEKVLRADLYLSFPEGRAIAKDQQEELANQLRRHSFVFGVHVGREQRYEYRGRQIFIRQSDLQLLHREGALVVLSKEPIDFERVLQGQDVLVTEPFCNRFQCRVGDQIRFPRMRHHITDGNITREESSASESFHTYTIAGILQDFSSDLGAVLLPPTQYRKLFGKEGRPTGISVYLQKGGDPIALQQLKESLRLEYGSRITIRDRRTLTAEALRVFHETFAVTYVLQVLSLLISSLFLVLELIASILYRKRERLTLQSIGAPLSFLKRIVITEALTLAATAILLGLGIGALLSWILVYRVNVLFFGWTVGFSMPVLQTVLYVVGFFTLSAVLAWSTVHFLFQTISAEELHYE